jgi:hypothetical protein
VIGVESIHIWMMKQLVADLRLKGRVGKRGLMFVSYYGRSRAFISNYRSWVQYHNEGKIAEIATSLISHEALHLVLNKFSLTASSELDNLFGRSNSWEDYIHGLGDLDTVHKRPRLRLKSATKISNRKKRKKK